MTSSLFLSNLFVFVLCLIDWWFFFAHSFFSMLYVFDPLKTLAPFYDQCFVLCSVCPLYFSFDLHYKCCCTVLMSAVLHTFLAIPLLKIALIYKILKIHSFYLQKNWHNWALTRSQTGKLISVISVMSNNSCNKFSLHFNRVH